MMVDTEMRLNGHAADEFYNMMTMVDSDTIRARDNFLSDISCQLDENGVLSIDIDDLDIDLESVDNWTSRLPYGIKPEVLQEIIQLVKQSVDEKISTHFNINQQKLTHTSKWIITPNWSILLSRGGK